MKYGMILLLAALTLPIAARGTDLNTSTAKGNAANSYPGYFDGDELKKFWEGGIGCPDFTTINDPDDEWWTYGNVDGKTYAAQMFVLRKPDGYDSGTLRWRVRGDSGLNVHLFRFSGDGFIHIDSNTGGSSPPTKEVTAPGWWFGDDEELIIMAVIETSAGHRGIDCDVVDIQY